MESAVDYSNAKLNYVKSGTGAQSMLLFHGFGQDHKAYSHLIGALKDKYTFYSFDLFFHGKSEWHNGEQPLEKETWKAIITKFFDTHDVQKISLMGFSLGCRFVMAIVEAFPEKIKDVFLIAPDGIKTSLWFQLATYPLLTRKVFKSMIFYPRSFRILVNALSEGRLMDRGLLKFVEHQMNTPKKRERVYYSWVVFRHLKFEHDQVSQLINTHHLNFIFIAGKHDRVIKAQSMNSFIKRLKHSQIEILNTGHHGLLKDPGLVEIVSRY